MFTFFSVSIWKWSFPCKNGGVCAPKYERNSYHCDCQPGFSGTHCKRGGIKFTHCEQFIKYSAIIQCSFTMVACSAGGYHVMTRRWSTGVESAPFKRACGLDNTCAATSHGFNCDKNDWNWREDSSLLTNKSKLHVIQMRFGDTGLPAMVMKMKRKSHAWKTGVLWT